MGIREVLNKYPYLGYSAIPVFAGIIIMSVRSAKDVEPTGIHTAFYTIDDGKSYFSDDSKLIPPFDYHGNQAVRAHVFTAKDGKPFVGYLDRVNPAAAAQIKKMQDRKPTDPPIPMSDMGIVITGHEYKRPGDKDWVKGSDMAQASKVRAIVGSDGTPLIEVDE
jgi:hypothetical protein